MTEHVYLPWVHSYEPSLAWIAHEMPDAISDVCDRLMFGESAAKDLAGADLVLALSDEHGVKLADSIPNTWNILVVSSRLRDVVVEAEPTVESYPVRLRNQKGRLVRDTYHLLNPIGGIDCMDRKLSNFTEDPVERGQVMRFQQLVLDTAKIPANRQLFRLASQKELVLVRKDLAYTIYRVHEYRGMIFQTLESFGAEFR